MAACIHCAASDAAYPFRVIDIQTLHIRDISGEKYVQAMGECADYAVCEACAKQYQSDVTGFGRKYQKKLIPAAGLILFGILYTLLVKVDILYMRLLGAIAVFLGLVIIVTVLKTYRDQKDHFSSLSEADALQHAAWLKLLDTLPKKNGDQDITYIPVNKTTKAMNARQLSETYDLLGAIAKQLKTALSSQ